MNWLLLALIIVAIAVVLLAKFLQRGRVNEPDYPYQKAGPLLSPAERSFYSVIKQAVGEGGEIFLKVRVADVVAPRKGLPRSDYQKAFNKVSGKHFDFVLCAKDDLSVICAIELDDSSHQSTNRQKRDEFLKKVCSAAQVALIQIPAKSGYVIADIKQLLTPYLGIVEFPNLQETIKAQASGKEEKTCPKCASSMVVRIAKKGSNAGKQFWACSSYPKCKHIEPINA